MINQYQFRIPYTFKELQTKAIKEINPMIQKIDYGNYLIVCSFDGEYYFNKIDNDHFLLDHIWIGDQNFLNMIDNLKTSNKIEESFRE